MKNTWVFSRGVAAGLGRTELRSPSAILARLAENRWPASSARTHPLAPAVSRPLHPR